MRIVNKIQTLSPNATIGEKIEYYRTNKGMSQTDLSKVLGVTKQAISNYEKGRPIDSEALVKIAKFFGVSADYLLGLTEFENINYNIRVVNKITGLSNGAIESLKELNKIKNKYDLLSTINFLIELEDINSTESNYIIGKIHNYFITKADSNEKIYITENGLKKITDFNNINDILIETRKVIATEKIVNELLLKDIQTNLEYLKNNYVNNIESKE